MHCQNTIVNQRRDWQVIEQIDKLLPEAPIVPASALVPEAINFRNILALVVATQQMHLTWVLDLECKQEADRFEALLATVNVVSQE